MLANEEQKELSEINVTPFIDVMLVLLIIFMVVAPMITSSVKLELPKSTAAQDSEKKPIILFINLEEISVNEEKVSLQSLGALIDSKTKGDKQSIIYFYVDKAVPYERLVAIIDAVKVAGFHKIALSQEVAK
ncbi:biopolymer transporter ExbD [Helicobacter jaachi]|uniref:Biopolymer transporter ExbD n=1 Tax=Helicobacter jaachi TaxID=1677920 RepID=A0A4V6I2T4_9HELI|nr:biopolymer transporter ExbD [Helicobacter jaachi]TLD97292.1 biopolymer transporter ExbD [Helicobacter jaachi]